MIHHVGVVAVDPRPVLATLRMLHPVELLAEKVIEEWECHCLMYRLGAGDTLFEVVIPLGGRLLAWYDERGAAGLHHVAVRVPSLDAACAALRTAQVRLVAPCAVEGVGGILVNFVHPAHCGVMVELVEVR